MSKRKLGARRRGRTRKAARRAYRRRRMPTDAERVLIALGGQPEKTARWRPLPGDIVWWHQYALWPRHEWISTFTVVEVVAIEPKRRSISQSATVRVRFVEPSDDPARKQGTIASVIVAALWPIGTLHR